MNCLFSLILLSILCADHSVSGQNVANSQAGLPMPECSTSCPSNKRCVQDNTTVVWELNSGNECLSYHSCYGSNSDYPDDTIPNLKFAGRFYPIVVALGSSVYFKAKYTNKILKPFTVYNVSQAMFLACTNASQVVGTLTSTIKLIPDSYFSSVGYKFFIAKGRGGSYITCNFGLRLHVNVMDVTNCSGTPSGNLCSGKGSCISESFTGNMYCECCSGYTGKYCEELDACSLDPCLHGNCSDVVAGHSQAFNCTCEPGYTGQQCDININECDLPENKGVCKNGAYCDDALNSYVCLCRNGFHGQHCEFISNLCDFIKPCKNNANCSRVGKYKESYVCHCAPGFYGRNCTSNSTTSSIVPKLSKISKTSFYQATSKLTSTAVHSYESSQVYLTTSRLIVSVIQSTTRFNTLSPFYSSVKTNPILEATSEKIKTTIFPTSFSELLRTSVEKGSITSSETSLVHDSSFSETNTFSETSTGVRSANAVTSDVFSTKNSLVNKSLSRNAVSSIVTRSNTPSKVILSSSSLLLSTMKLPSSTNQQEVSKSIPKLPSSFTKSNEVSMTTSLQQVSTVGIVQTPNPSVVVSSMVSPSYEFLSSVTMATNVVTYPKSTTNLPTTRSTISQMTTHLLSKLPSSIISPSVTIVSPSSTVLPSQPPLRNQTCSDNPCGDNGVCKKRDSSLSGLLFHCDCPYPTVGPVCNTDHELHFPYFNGNSYIQYKPIAFGSMMNEFVISFRTIVDGTILFSGHRTYRDFIKLEVVGGLLRFSVDAGDKVVSVTSQENVANGNTTSANFGYDTRTGSVFISVNNGAEQRRTTRGQLRNVFLHYPLYLGGIVPIIYTETKPDVGRITPFVGCLRELEFNERALELSDAVNWQNISECDLPACQAKPCKNSGVCFQDNEDVNKYSCECPYPYSGENCEEKYACAVNVCNGGKCLNSSMSGVECLCSFGRGGVTCNQDIKVSIPTFNVVKNHSSYLQYLTPRGAVNQLDLRMDIKFSNDTKSRGDGLLFYIGLHNHLSVGSDGDYLALGVINNRIMLQFNLGSGAGKVTSEVLNLDQEWFSILAGRKGRDGYLYVDNQVKEGQSPPPLQGLNVFGNLYLGGIPESTMLNSEVMFTEGFRGTIKDPRIRTGASNEWMTLSMEHSTNITNLAPVITGLNIQDQKVNACVVGACLNNGSCESLGASYVCRCPPEWSGMMCNDTSVPCRNYNPCHGLSTCRMRDSGFTCDCPPGKSGSYCENDMNITTPFFGEYSYLSFSLDKIKIHVQTSVTLVFSTPAENGILFYVTHDITTHSGDFLSITLYKRNVFLIFNLGTGIAKCESESEIHLNQNNSIIMTRTGKTSNLQLNGNKVSCSSRGGATQLNVASVFYLGGVPDLSQVQPLAYENSQALRDFTGCVEELKINGRSFDLTQRGVLNGRNIVNCDRSSVQV